jgi:FlaA1/EpsC-like NDP-sugar epimerase
MGEPVKLVDLAHDLLRLSGLEPGRDIDLVFTGLRPGEKLVEELFGGAEPVSRTAHHKIFVVPNGQAGHTPESLAERIDGLIAAAEAGQDDRVMELFRRLVPEYDPLPTNAERDVSPDAMLQANAPPLTWLASDTASD